MLLKKVEKKDRLKRAEDSPMFDQILKYSKTAGKSSLFLALLSHDDFMATALQHSKHVRNSRAPKEIGYLLKMEIRQST